jgi:hypothetical protein
MKREGSLSPPSSDSQATAPWGEPDTCRPWIHSANRVVLPKPAGAEIRVSLRCSPWLRRSTRRGRRTRLRRRGGMWSFVVRSAMAMASPHRASLTQVHRGSQSAHVRNGHLHCTMTSGVPQPHGAGMLRRQAQPQLEKLADRYSCGGFVLHAPESKALPGQGWPDCDHSTRTWSLGQAVNWRDGLGCAEAVDRRASHGIAALDARGRSFLVRPALVGQAQDSHPLAPSSGHVDHLNGTHIVTRGSVTTREYENLTRTVPYGILPVRRNDR